jgi:hypothetical protein
LQRQTSKATNPHQWLRAVVRGQLLIYLIFQLG